MSDVSIDRSSTTTRVSAWRRRGVMACSIGWFMRVSFQGPVTWVAEAQITDMRIARLDELVLCTRHA